MIVARANDEAIGTEHVLAAAQWDVFEIARALPVRPTIGRANNSAAKKEISVSVKTEVSEARGEGSHSFASGTL